MQISTEEKAERGIHCEKKNNNETNCANKLIKFSSWTWDKASYLWKWHQPGGWSVSGCWLAEEHNVAWLKTSLDHSRDPEAAMLKDTAETADPRVKRCLSTWHQQFWCPPTETKNQRPEPAKGSFQPKQVFKSIRQDSLSLDFVSGASYKCTTAISSAANTHWAGKSKSLSEADAHLTSRGNLNISCSLSPSSLLAVPPSCPHHWPDVYKQFPSVRPSAFHFDILWSLFFCNADLHANVSGTKLRKTTIKIWQTTFLEREICWAAEM